MSRIGKKPIQIPKGVEVKVEGQKVYVKGPKGEISIEIRPEIKIELKNDEILIFPQEKKEDLKKIKAFWGLSRILIANMVEGVINGFEKKLEIKGVGFKAEALEKEIVLNLGFSHPSKLKIPEGIKVSVEKSIIIISGIDKERVGHFASIIKKLKPTEPYKGKGIKYVGEIVIRKAGKKVATTAK